ncbi:HAD family hydrolase [Trypanosoma rangeli]|uniref:HAD family hydrolase n=1 Tax=Trypanosoma rangeli TaxID=5698 RepID=A0A422N520_TRYRA|nr:HAD family hydrolase [Trypanosoma rangeli]RNF00531.1 HAD family hydrolase [Trypanosoma rangeli]|eukprot:RNF00531.1 HAD family hydrolase [Trypanosoma rangeli]
MNRLVILLDIDNTLYRDKEQGGILHQMQEGLVEYVANLLQFSTQEAEAYVVHSYEKYGLTIAGLMQEHKGLDAQAVTDFLYSRCDFSQLPEDPGLREVLSRLRQNHHIYYLTNAPRRHAETVLQRIGLSTEELIMHGFTYEDQWAHTAPMICNKPHRNTYIAVMDAVSKGLQYNEKLTAECMVMVDDTASNLLEPLALGWNAVWVSHGNVIPDTLLAHMNTGKLFLMKDSSELEDVIGHVTLKRNQ